MKTSKRVLRDNTEANGSLDSDKVSLALLQYLNTPFRCVDKSPAQLVTGCQLRDCVLAVKQNFKTDSHWGRTLRQRVRQIGSAH